MAAETVRRALEVAIATALQVESDIAVTGGATRNTLTKDSIMPEGPEIRRAADNLEAAVKGKPLTEVWFAFEQL
ncbi:hypothetical protein ACV8U7_27045, partial [Citrobacter freundii]